jgi:hypothetical protein
MRKQSADVHRQSERMKRSAPIAHSKHECSGIMNDSLMLDKIINFYRFSNKLGRSGRKLVTEPITATGVPGTSCPWIQLKVRSVYAGHEFRRNTCVVKQGAPYSMRSFTPLQQ